MKLVQKATCCSHHFEVTFKVKFEAKFWRKILKENFEVNILSRDSNSKIFLPRYHRNSIICCVWVFSVFVQRFLAYSSVISSETCDFSSFFCSISTYHHKTHVNLVEPVWRGGLFSKINQPFSFLYRGFFFVFCWKPEFNPKHTVIIGNTRRLVCR